MCCARRWKHETTQSLRLCLFLTFDQGFLAPGEIDPLNRRFSTNFKPDVVVQGWWLNDPIMCPYKEQQKLSVKIWIEDKYQSCISVWIKLNTTEKNVHWLKGFEKRQQAHLLQIVPICVNLLCVVLTQTSRGSTIRCFSCSAVFV